MKPERLKTLFNPESVAVAGATDNENKMGYHVMKSLVESFDGRIYPVNPGKDQVFGIAAYPGVEELPEAPDLAIIVIPREKIHDTVKKFIERGTGAFVIITSGFREAEMPDGGKLHEKLRNLVERANAVVIGPNTFGIVNVRRGLNASFTPALFKVRGGSIALVSQSGGICHLLAPYAMREGIGFSKIIGLGNRLNVDFPEILEYLATDDDTRCIALYIEGTENPRRMLDEIVKITRSKPVVALKAGRFEKADRASRSHTGSMAGDYRIFVSALKQYGAVVAETLEELISFAKALSMQKPMFGDRVAVVSLVAGLGMVACDTAEKCGMKLAEFSENTRSQLYELLPPYTIRDNPVDLGFVASDVELCGKAIELIAEDRNVDGIVLNYVYSWSGDFLQVPVDSIIRASGQKPMTVCLNYPPGTWDDVREKIEANGIPVYSTPEMAVKSLKALGDYGKILLRE
ncbi:acetyl-CoA synthetase [Geoglobus acetivorans]|uniref:acetate--CoA ligase (ADP-forming) n=2 Tax=Geoglobus acetivorans TaxID=565033 RepID=A0A0A7GDE1_GEOAI|nr:acetyl-CoA synthetase [Geoglobus acetivorans]